MRTYGASFCCVLFSRKGCRYLSPPPTEKRSLQVPDTPRGRIPRKTTR